MATTGGDNRNLMIVQIAKAQFGRTRVVARLKDPIRSAKYREMGIETLCVTTVVEGLLELWALKGEFPELPGEASSVRRRERPALSALVASFEVFRLNGPCRVAAAPKLTTND